MSFSIASIALLALPAAALCLFAYAFYRVWRWGIVGRIAVSLVAGFLSYGVFLAIWPDDSFFLKDFERATNVRLPADTKVLGKTASYPDIQGDYWSEAVLRLAPEQFEALLLEMQAQPKTACGATPAMAKRNISAGVTAVYCFRSDPGSDLRDWRFFSDGVTVYFRFWWS